MESLLKWKKIKGYPGYWISEEGDVISMNYNRSGKAKELTPSKNSVGYLMVNLYKTRGAKQKTLYIHRLVAEAFIENPENKEEVNHKDHDKLNNHYSNLEWMTRLENVRYSVKMGRMNCDRKGEKSPLSKITKKGVLALRKEHKNWVKNGMPVTLDTWLLKYCDKYNMTLGGLKGVLYGKTWKHI